MGGEDDRIPGLDRHQGFGENGGGGVGGGDETRDHAHRPGDLVDPPGGVLADDAHGFQVADALPDRARTEFVLEFLVRGDAVTGFLSGLLTQAFGSLEACFRH